GLSCRRGRRSRESRCAALGVGRYPAGGPVAPERWTAGGPLSGPAAVPDHSGACFPAGALGGAALVRWGRTGCRGAHVVGRLGAGAAPSGAGRRRSARGVSPAAGGGGRGGSSRSPPAVAGGRIGRGTGGRGDPPRRAAVGSPAPRRDSHR